MNLKGQRYIGTFGKDNPTFGLLDVSVLIHLLPTVRLLACVFELVPSLHFLHLDHALPDPSRETMDLYSIRSTEHSLTRRWYHPRRRAQASKDCSSVYAESSPQSRDVCVSLLVLVSGLIAQEDVIHMILCICRPEVS